MLLLFVCHNIHISVGFSVARSDNRAMPEPRDVGRVQVDSHVFFVYIQPPINDNIL